MLWTHEELAVARIHQGADQLTVKARSVIALPAGKRDGKISVGE